MSTGAKADGTARTHSLAAGNTGLDVRRHMPALDGIRGLAILMVLVFHFIGNTQATNAFERIVVSVANYGSFGVELFFVLSGFLITGILYDARDTPNYFRNFYMRRILRIFPLYYGVLVLVFVVAPLIPVLRGPTLDFLVEHQAWAWLYAVNIYIAMVGEWSFSYLQHFWSLAVEEHFYLFWPFVVFFLAGRPKRLMGVCLGLVAFAILSRLIGAVVGLSWWTTYVFTPFRLDGLALGALMAVAARQPGGQDRLLTAMPRVAAGAVLLFAGVFVWNRVAPVSNVEIVMTVRAAIIQILLACLLLRAISAPRGTRTAQFFCSRPMLFLGTYSYGLYVYHHFFSHYFSSHGTEFMLAEWIGSHTAAVALQASGGIAVSIAIAYLSYEFFERRFLRMKRFFEANWEPPTALDSSAADPAHKSAAMHAGS